MARPRKSKPFAVRLEPKLADWVERYVEETGMSKTAVFEAAVEMYRKSERRRLNGKKKTILSVLKNDAHGS